MQKRSIVLFPASDKLQHPDQQQPRGAVVDADRDQVVDRGDQGTRRDGGIDPDPFEEQGRDRTDQRRDRHRDEQRRSDAARGGERKDPVVLLDEMDRRCSPS